MRFFFTGLLLLSSSLFAERLPGRYIVELNTESVSEHIQKAAGRPGMRSAAASAHRTRVRGEQQGLRVRLAQHKAVVLDSVDTVANALFVQVSDQSAAQLANLPGVKRVIPVRMVHMVLDRAVVLHKIADVWNEIGSDRAGVGIKIAIIDSGIDSTQPGLQDSSLTVPAGFPKVNSDADIAYTNNKIIVARSYVNLLSHADADLSARDRVGHGTALAMIAAGVRNSAPLATITGVAPKAFLGNYKVFGSPGVNDSASDDAIIKAIDDAVADGMDIINLSLGTDLGPRLSDDLDVQAVERATKAGVIVVVAAGNGGPDPSTISSPGSAPSAIAVGGSTNDRKFASSVSISGFSPFLAIAGSGVPPASSISASVVDVASIDSNGLACSALPANSLQGNIALILRGSCSFTIKLTNANNAGASGAIVYATADSPNPISMNVGAATLPAEMIGHADGYALQQRLSTSSSLTGALQFTLGPVGVVANHLVGFSAAGPNVDLNIKPDLLAVGSDMYVATQTLDPAGKMYNPSGFILVNGTSFSTPLVAGAAALIKGARPGLTVNQYRSLLINSSAAAAAIGGQTLSVQQTGAGILDVTAALHSTVSAYPTSLSFGGGNTEAQLDRVISLSNLGRSDETFSITANPTAGGPSPSILTNSVRLAAGASINIPVSWNAAGLPGGAYEGSLVVSGTSGTQAHIPYWYATPTLVPARITALKSIASGRRRGLQRDAILFRITDASGLILPGVTPEVISVSGGGTVRGIVSHDDEVPGLFGVDVQLGAPAGANLFRIQVGDVSLDVTISGT